MRLTNWKLFPELLFTLASVQCYRKYDLGEISEILKSGIDETSSPCDNFYNYSCGKWIENNEIPQMIGRWDVYKMTETTIHSVIRDILEGSINESNPKLLLEKRFYDSCMDTNSSRKEGKNLVKKMLSETEGSSWQDIVEYYAIKIGEILLFDVTLNKENYLQIERPLYSGLNKKPYEKGSVELHYKLRALSVLRNKTSSYLKTLRSSIGFIEALNHLVYNSEAEVHKMTILELQQLYDESCPSSKAKIQWFNIFQKLADGSGMNFTYWDSIYVDEKYMKELCQLLGETPKTAIVDYLHLNFIFNGDMYLYINLGMDFWNDTMRYDRCIMSLPILDQTYAELVKSYIPKEAKNMVRNIIRGMKATLITEIENSWLVGAVKEAALKKVAEVKYSYALMANFPKRHLTDTSHNFDVGSIGLQNQINFQKACRISDILKCKTNVRHRGKRSSNANACYSQKINRLYIAPTFMFPPFYDLNAPIGFNYGRLGYTIGHELSHAFDYSNMKNLFNCILTDIPSAREEKMKLILEEKKNCFVSNFNEFGINGLRTLDENIADKQGTSLAFKTMNIIKMVRNLKRKRLSNFNAWKQKNLFFLSYANQWCSNPIENKPEIDDEHSPNVFRVIGTLKNMNEFAETFKCKKQKAMNPISKCDLWSKPSKHGYSFKKYLNLN